MDTIEVFKQRVEGMRALIKNKDEEYVRVEVQGLEVREMQRHRNAELTLEIHGFDENGVETVLVCPSGHFSAKLSFEPKKKQSQPIGFKAFASKEAQQIKIQ